MLGYFSSMLLHAISHFRPVLVEINGGLDQMSYGAVFGMITEDLKK